MKISKTVVTFDTADLDAESAFWAGVYGGTVKKEPDWHTVYVDGEPRLAFQLAPNHVKPDWPNGQPQQLHLDVYIDDIESGHEHVTGLGARLLDSQDEHGFRVYADPSGHPFCLCW